jgi:hypothetical protein
MYINLLLGWRDVKVRDDHTLDARITNATEVLYSGV